MIWFLVLLNITAPHTIYDGQLYDVHITVTSNESLNGTLYTYVYRGLSCISTGWWHGINVSINPGVNEFNIKDSVKIGAPEGFYRMKVKLVSGNRSWQVIREVEVRHSNFPYIALLPLMLIVFILLRWLL